MGYYEYLPPSYTDAGAAEPAARRASTVTARTATGPPTASATSSSRHPTLHRCRRVADRPAPVVLAPQHVEDPPGFDFAPCDSPPWFGSCAMQLQHDRGHASPAFCTTPGEIHDFITYAVARYNVDPKRIYVTGLSCGGFGAWEYLATYGDEQVAAAIPIAGEGRPHGQRPAVDSIRSRSGPSTVGSTTSSIRGEASSR